MWQRETTLRYNIDEIYDNLYEELGDVIIMMLQFIYKNNLECEKLLNEMSKKINTILWNKTIIKLYNKV